MAEYTLYLQDAMTNGVRNAVLVPDGATAPASHTEIGSFVHANADHDAIYHHVRDLLYHEGIYNMQAIRIVFDDEVFVTAIDLTRTAVSIVAGQNTTVGVNIRPGWATEKDFTVTSDDTLIATVAFNSTTRIITVTGVAAGTCTVLVEYDDDNTISAELEVTITAAG